jgi:hypothetical protein
LETVGFRGNHAGDLLREDSFDSEDFSVGLQPIIGALHGAQSDAHAKHHTNREQAEQRHCNKQFNQGDTGLPVSHR